MMKSSKSVIIFNPASSNLILKGIQPTVLFVMISLLHSGKNKLFFTLENQFHAL